jgi:predicted NUDIX family phosphoesterase
MISCYNEKEIDKVMDINLMEKNEKEAYYSIIGHGDYERKPLFRKKEISYEWSIKTLYDNVPESEMFKNKLLLIKWFQKERFKDWGKRILCVDSLLSGKGNYHTETRIRSLPDFNSTSLQTFDSKTLPISGEHSFLESELYFFKPRYEVENNPNYRQVCVSAYITDGKNIILLKSIDGRLEGNLTLVQGHVDFSKEAYIMNHRDFLLFNIKRDLEEEIGLTIDATNLRPKFFIWDSSNYIALEHAGFTYEIRVTDCHELMKELKNNEPYKHEIGVYMLKNMTMYKKDSWLSLIVDKINK